MRSLERHVTARGLLDAQGLEAGTQGLPAENAQGVDPDAQGLDPDTQGLAPDATPLIATLAGDLWPLVTEGKLERRYPDNPAHPQQAYRAVGAGASP